MSQAVHTQIPCQDRHSADHGVSDTSMASHHRIDPPQQPSLAGLHQRTVAVELALDGRQQVLLGRGVYERDDQLGGLLRIELLADAGCEFVLVENSWNGEIQSDPSHGCEFLIRLL